MTSLTMYSEWTAPTMLSSMWTKPETKRTKVAHQVSGWVRVVDTTVRVFYPWWPRPLSSSPRCCGRPPRMPTRRTRRPTTC